MNRHNNRYKRVIEANIKSHDTTIYAEGAVTRHQSVWRFTVQQRGRTRQQENGPRRGTTSSLNRQAKSVTTTSSLNRQAKSVTTTSSLNRQAKSVTTTSSLNRQAKSVTTTSSLNRQAKSVTTTSSLNRQAKSVTNAMQKLAYYIDTKTTNAIMVTDVDESKGLE